MPRKNLVERKLAEQRRARTGTDAPGKAAARAAAAPGSAVLAQKFGVERREMYLEALRAGALRRAAAKAAGVTPETVSRAKRLDPRFAEQCAEAELTGVEPVELVLMEAALRGEPWAVTMVLKARDRERFGERDKRVDVVVSGTVEVEAGERLGRIAELERKLTERIALEQGGDGGAGEEDAVLVEDD